MKLIIINTLTKQVLIYIINHRFIAIINQVKVKYTEKMFS